MSEAEIYRGYFYDVDGKEYTPEQVREIIGQAQRDGWGVKLQLVKLDWDYIKKSYAEHFNRLAEIEGDEYAHERALELLSDELDIIDSALKGLIPYPGKGVMLDNMKNILWVKKFNEQGYREPLCDEFFCRDV